MIDYTPLFNGLRQTRLAPWVDQLAEMALAKLDPAQHGDIAKWQAALDALPKAQASNIDLNNPCLQIGTAADLGAEQQAALEQALRKLHPWRKGPFCPFGLHIDTEWRCDWKWARLQEHITPLQDRLILDVGSGNGYYAWRMVAAGARWVLGVDPTLLYAHQFEAMRRYIGDTGAWVLPLAMEDLPANTKAFDTVFSMGVLYHRRSPFDHLFELRDALRPGGELVLETLVIEGGAGDVLVPADRYARMRNVWFIPSPAELEAWLVRAGFEKARIVDVNATTVEEQRSTDWMQFESLDKCLDPGDPNKTVEGYPAPRRAVLIAQRPA